MFKLFAFLGFYTILDFYTIILGSWVLVCSGVSRGAQVCSGTWAGVMGLCTSALGDWGHSLCAHSPEPCVLHAAPCPSPWSSDLCHDDFLELSVSSWERRINECTIPEHLLPACPSTRRKAAGRSLCGEKEGLSAVSRLSLF